MITIEEKTFSPATHPAGVNTHLKLEDDKEIKGIVYEFTSDSVFIQTEDELLQIHPHEIKEVIE